LSDKLFESELLKGMELLFSLELGLFCLAVFSGVGLDIRLDP